MRKENNNYSLFDMLPDNDPQKEYLLGKTSNDWNWSMKNDYPKEKNGLKVFSCFACGGGSTMGYRLAGCEVIGCCEIDKRMNDIYVANHHPKHNYLMDIARSFTPIAMSVLPQTKRHALKKRESLTRYFPLLIGVCQKPIVFPIVSVCRLIGKRTISSCTTF